MNDMNQRYIVLFFLIFQCFNLQSFAQQDTVQISEIEIQSSRVPRLYSENIRVMHVISRNDIEKSPAMNLTELLGMIPSIDIRQRGAAGIQGDLSIRGGTIEQTMVLIDGVQMNDPQTGHHTLNLPIGLDDIERIEILEGPGSRIFGPNAFSGAVNLITRSAKTNRLQAGIMLGEYGLNSQQLSLNLRQKKWANAASVSRSSSDGYITNTDFNQFQLMNRIDYTMTSGKLSITGGLINRAFGAYKFYTGTYPWQFEQAKTGMTNLNYESNGPTKIKAGIYWRRNNDRFELFREGDGWYNKQGNVYVRNGDTAGFPTANGLFHYAGHNFHRTDVMGTEANLSRNGRFGRTAIGFSWRRESILSNVLGKALDKPIMTGSGETLFTVGKSRNNLNGFAEYAIHARLISFSVGLLAYWNSDFGWYVHPGLDLGVRINRNWRTFASVNQSLRLPTFTDLYYKGPVNEANPHLKPESSLNWESGIKFERKQIRANLTVFLREGKNIIDWVRPADSVKWISMNHTSLRTKGIEGQIGYHASEVSVWYVPEQFALASSFYSNSKHSGNLHSAYALDYVRFKFVLTARHHVTSGLSFSWNLTYREREGGWYDAALKQTIPYDPLWMLDARLTWQHGKWKMYAGATNLLNTPYYDIANVQMPGRWISGGISYILVFY